MSKKETLWFSFIRIINLFLLTFQRNIGKVIINYNFCGSAKILQ